MLAKSGSKHQFSLALVTGATSGIGTALCRLLAEKHIPLLITGRDSKRLNELADELKQIIPVISLTADLGEAAGRVRLIEKIHECKPDLVVNNAGFGLYGDALTYQTQEQVEILDVNATALLELTLESARAMISVSKRGVIMNISSASDKFVFPGLAVYAASKAFVTMLSQSLDFELAPYGVRVLTSRPGVVNTYFRIRASGNSNAQTSKKAMDTKYAANDIWNQIVKQKRVRIFDWKTRLSCLVGRLLPKNWIAPILAKTIKKLHPPRSLKM